MNEKLPGLFKLFAALCVLVSGCTYSKSNNSRGDSLLKASVYVQRYGQITNQKQKNYLHYIEKRLATALEKGSYQSRNFNIILLNTPYPIAASLGDGVILISKGIIKSLNSEAELAFILAHEMAHQHLNHAIPEHPEDAAEIDETKELEADRLSFATIAAAGYDPRYAIAALKNTYQYSRNLILDNEDYPSLEARELQIQELVNTSGWLPPGSISRAEFKDFKRSLF